MKSRGYINYSVKQSIKRGSLKVASAILCIVMQEARCESTFAILVNVGIKSVTHCRDVVREMCPSISLPLGVLARNLSLKDIDINCLRTFSDYESRRSTPRNFA